MKITYLLTWADAIGGTERTVLRQANWLAHRHEVEVIGVLRTRDEMPFEVDPAVKLVHLLDTRGGVTRPVRGGMPDAVAEALAAAPSTLVRRHWEGAFSALSDLELERVLGEIDADVVVTTTPALLAVAATLLPRRVVIVAQEHRVTELRGSSGEPFGLFAARADAIALLSRPTRDWFAELLVDAAPRLVVLPNPIEDGYRPRSTRETRTVVMAGRLSPEKQFEHAIAAFGQIAPDHPDWRLRIFGGGSRARLEERIAGLKLGNQVQLLGPTESIEDEWAKASVAMVTSRVESFGLTLIEAMSAAVPVVAYDCPNGPREVIEDGETGFLVAPDNIDELAAALRKLVEDDGLRHLMGHAALRDVERFSVEKVMPQWEQLFADLLADRGRPGWTDRRLAAVAAQQARRAAPNVVPSRAVARSIGEVDVEAWAAGVEAGRDDLIWTRGQLTRLRDSTPYEVARDNLDLTVDSLDAAGIDYFLVRQMSPTFRVAVREETRQSVVAALARRHAGRPVYVEAFDQRNRTMGVWPAAATIGVTAMATAAWLRVFEPAMTQSQTLRLGTIYGCAVEFWQTTEDGSDLCGPTRTLVGERLAAASLAPAVVTVGGRNYRSVEPFTRRLADEITFPIDLVYTWVDGADPVWARRRAEALGIGYAEEGALQGAERFRSRDELRYSLRSVDLFAPWVNRIWIVTDGQVPDWLDTAHPKVRIVDHQEIFADPSVLPTFNSHAIETQLHHIEGLSEHFVYLNDDVFFGRLFGPDMFFDPGGLPKAFKSPTQIPLTPPSPDDEAFAVAAKNNRRLLEGAFGKTLIHAFLHAPHAHRRSTLYDIEAAFPESVRQTAANRIRSTDDVSMLSSLAHHFGLMSGRTTGGAIRCTFANVGLAAHLLRLDNLLAGRAFDVFCLNDYHDGDVPAEDQARIIEAFLGAYFPVASQFERGSERNRRLSGAGGR
ncbi:stealth conserved region 3 domain-containing protein [Micromonospora zamorensis]|uniref:stealth conserved region 3 domain-containing protein n=1 Tax=Micromonospora zamorensis TaxID=709883 RepID=UPI0037AF8867